MLNIVCVKWGKWCSPHGVRYVNNLFHGVARNLSLEHRFICFTDDPSGLDPGIEVRPLPGNLKGWWWEKLYPRPRRDFWRIPLALPYLFMRSRDVGRGLDEDRLKTWRPIDLRGWYNKLYIFKPGVLEGTSVYLDLDLVILGSLDDLFTTDSQFCVLRDFFLPRDFNSSILYFQPEDMGVIWEEFVRRGCPVVKGGDQAFIESIRPKADYFQDRLPGQVVSYKLQCQVTGVPDYARVLCFHGKPRPHQVEDICVLQNFDLPAAPAVTPVTAS